ncbi:MAG: bifunctional riboflavin kinase/FAD synthetase [Nitriliruptoraceae bacterium]
MSAVVTVGNFDGVHRGHLALVDRAVAVGAARGVPAAALTFDPHPAAVLRPDAAPGLLQALDERVAALRAAGLDDVVVRRFDAALAALDPEAFVADVLLGERGAVAVVVGENFRFGRGATGDVARLRELCAAAGVAVEAVPLVGEGGTVVSSSALRAALAAGDVAAVSAGLGRPYALAGEVVRGDGRGRTIGVPTANVAVDPARALPADGVYACRVTGTDAGGAPVAGPAVVNVGRRPTFDGVGRTVEAHLLDAPPDLDLYGGRLRLEPVARIRGEQRFDGPEALVARIHEDVAEARRLLA